MQACCAPGGSCLQSLSTAQATQTSRVSAVKAPLRTHVPKTPSAAPSPMANVRILTLALEPSTTAELLLAPRWRERENLQRLLAACTSLRRLHLHFQLRQTYVHTLEHLWQRCAAHARHLACGLIPTSPDRALAVWQSMKQAPEHRRGCSNLQVSVGRAACCSPWRLPALQA